jgi:hypothetical protein
MELTSEMRMGTTVVMGIVLAGKTVEMKENVKDKRTIVRWG